MCLFYLLENLSFTFLMSFLLLHSFIYMVRVQGNRLEPTFSLVLGLHLPICSLEQRLRYHNNPTEFEKCVHRIIGTGCLQSGSLCYRVIGLLIVSSCSMPSYQTKDKEILLEYCKAHRQDHIVHSVENCHAYQQVHQNNLQNEKRQ